jgi:hypothetical protein
VVERSDGRIPFSLKPLKRLGQTRIAEARPAVADARRPAENTEAIRGESKLFNARFLKALRDRKELTWIPAVKEIKCPSVKYSMALNSFWERCT